MEELREIMADLGFRNVTEMVGQVDSLQLRENIDPLEIQTPGPVSNIVPRTGCGETGLYKQEEQDHGIGRSDRTGSC